MQATHLIPAGTSDLAAVCWLVAVLDVLDTLLLVEVLLLAGAACFFGATAEAFLPAAAVIALLLSPADIEAAFATLLLFEDAASDAAAAFRSFWLKWTPQNPSVLAGLLHLSPASVLALHRGCLAPAAAADAGRCFGAI
jgi:hypothetical protein